MPRVEPAYPVPDDGCTDYHGLTIQDYYAARVLPVLLAALIDHGMGSETIHARSRLAADIALSVGRYAGDHGRRMEHFLAASESSPPVRG